MINYYDTGEKYFIDADIYMNKCKVSETATHSHSFVEIAFVAEGEGIHKIGTLEFPCSKGEIYIINHDVEHQFIARENSELLIYNCVFKPTFFNYSFIDSKRFYDVTYGFLIKTIENDVNLKSPKITPIEMNIDALFEEMLAEYESKDEAFVEVLKADLIKLIIMILRTIRKENKDNKIIPVKNELLEKVIDYIHSNYYKEVTIEELSMQAFLSQSHFCRLFKEYAGMTVKELTQRIRINEACNLLISTNKKIGDIAYEIGYNDVKHFNSLFKKITGKTPNEYKKSR